MNAKKFSDAMSELDSKYIDEAINYKKKSQKPRWIKWGAVAACVAVAILIGVRMVPPEKDGLLMLTIPDLESSGMGFESWLGYDISQWDNGNPWSESMEFSVLPVYQNGSYDSAGKPVGLSQADMKQRLETVIAALNLDNYDIETEQECLTANTDGLRICVYADGLIEVWFENGRTLPEGYNFTLFDTTDAEAEQVLEYLSQEYSKLIDLSEHKKVLSGSYIIWNDYDEAGNYITEPHFEREYALYDSAGDELEDILNYNFNCVRFYPDDSGKLSLIRIYSGLSCAEKIGDYPIISTDEAYELLLKGNYVTSVPYAITDTELICKVELVYRNSRTEKTFLPYYRFYIELPEMQRENGLTDYGAYYVPAIQEEYIRNMPVWDGSIN